jgi:hypothetical protein
VNDAMAGNTRCQSIFRSLSPLERTREGDEKFYILRREIVGFIVGGGRGSLARWQRQEKEICDGIISMREKRETSGGIMRAGSLSPLLNPEQYLHEEQEESEALVKRNQRNSISFDEFFPSFCLSLFVCREFVFLPLITFTLRFNHSNELRSAR